MQFGVFVPQGWTLDLAGLPVERQWPVMCGLAQAADCGGWKSIWVFDHFHTVPVVTNEATHEAWTLMAAFAAVTERVHLGQMCTCICYRNPAYLAKVAATVDIVSGGRAQVGVGAGWYEQEFRAYGYDFPAPGARLGMLEEGVRIMRDLWSEGRSTTRGKHFDVDGAVCRPLPLQEGGIPLWIAGSGEKKTLRIVAQYADYANFNPEPEEFVHKSDVLARHCAELSRDFGSITRSANYPVIIGSTEREVQERLGWITAHYAPLVPPAELATLEHTYRTAQLIGTPEQIVDKLRAAERAGMTYAICTFAEAAFDRSGMELFEREVIPAFV